MLTGELRGQIDGIWNDFWWAAGQSAAGDRADHFSHRLSPASSMAAASPRISFEFVDLVIERLTARGVMDPRILYESPFTDFDSNGIAGVFEHADVVRLIEVLRELEPRSAA